MSDVEAHAEPSTVGPTPEVISTCDPFQDAAIGMAFVTVDGRFLRVNPALCDLLGRDSDTLLASTWSELTHPDDLQASRDQITALLSGQRRRIDFEKRYLRPDGEVVIARVTSAITVVDGEPVFFTQLHDATDEAAALTTMCAAEQRFSALTSCSSDAIYWLRLEPEIRFRYVSDSAAAMTGYTVDELYADPDLRHRVVHQDDWHLLEAIRAGIVDGTSSAALLRWVRRDGTVIWVEQRMKAIAEVDGVVTGVLGVARDVTERVEADRAHVRRDAQQRAVIDLAHACIATHQPGTVLDEAVAAVDRLMSGDQVAVWWEVEPHGEFRLAAGAGFLDLEVGRSIVDGTTSHAARVRANGARTSFERVGTRSGQRSGDELAGEGVTNGVGVPIPSDGRAVGVLAAYSRDLDPDPDDVLFMQAMANTIGACADRSHFEEELGYLTLHDPLTGLPNRTLLVEHLTRSLAAAGDEKVVVALCGLDDFKLLNEAMGRDVGDRALATVAERLQGIVPGGMVARAGGDEFAIIISLSASGALAETLAIDAIAAMHERFSVGAAEVSVSLSVGLSVGSSADSATEMLASALAALHRAKSRGRGQWMHASGAEQGAAVRRLDLTNRLHDAVRAGAIRAHFQPIVCLRQGDIVGFEALARWERDDGVTVPPDEFIPIAEDTGLIREVGLSILDDACSFLEAAREHGAGHELMVTVNVSPHQLDDPRLIDEVEAVLARHAIPRRAVCLELTESALVPGDRTMVERLHALKRLGVSLGIDDFGTGYSSFAYLTQFPIDLLKLDRAFVTDLQDDPRRVAVVRSIISLARTLGIVVLAEGIETTTERDTLAELDCELGQGFLWSRPIPAPDARALLAGRDVASCESRHESRGVVALHSSISGPTR